MIKVVDLDDKIGRFGNELYLGLRGFSKSCIRKKVSAEVDADGCLTILASDVQNSRLRMKSFVKPEDLFDSEFIGVYYT